jgi:hypothetical protein
MRPFSEVEWERPGIPGLSTPVQAQLRAWSATSKR